MLQMNDNNVVKYNIQDTLQIRNYVSATTCFYIIFGHEVNFINENGILFPRRHVNQIINLLRIQSTFQLVTKLASYNI